ncbi:PEP-CTERM sorting domain-containing protein [Actimicrobium sp. CCI2.3]|uniref:PEP-CTERM sorting domain-containing protein n=1 Tax=Actimicrobium sp. CCI2.3 TaxID=3048616 RepID=UPI002AB4B0A5|nr:PEP-CTERM sorting domain-containing protein [Actimicrobium sp. CCI2.3]MDY7574184.1 PEP-CTERM sorting domain-containing protein [Actimicrobium sp. CCI2.3]MEB0024002.1 PEP-CTERM sorting domain-containing protein [Actimicrobium sp. CCI2.3]
MIKSFALRLSAAILFSCFSNLSHAALTVFTSLADFTAATRAPGVDTFNDLDFNGYPSSPVIRQAGAYAYTATASTASFYVAGSASNAWLSTDISTDAVTFSGFSPGAQAISGYFFGSDIRGLFANGTVKLIATDQTGTVIQTIANATVNSFLGVVSGDALRSLTVLALSSDATALWPTVDNLTIGLQASSVSPVPEPGSMTMLLSGLGLLGLLARRRRK